MKPSLQKLRDQLGETDKPIAVTPALRQQHDPGAASARGPPGLEPHYRYNDLRELGIVPNWPTLSAWIRERGFPPGKLIFPRIRIWSASSIQGWLDKQTSTQAA